MNILVDAPRAELSVIPSVMSGSKFFNQNFTGADFRRRDMRRSTFFKCTFDDADMTEADCSGSEFIHSTFRRTNCRGINLKDAKLRRTIFEPSDFFDMTMTFNCATFQDMQVSRDVHNGFLFIALALMIPPKDEDGFDPRAGLISALGRDYYLEHAEKFKARTL